MIEVKKLVNNEFDEDFINSLTNYRLKIISNIARRVIDKGTNVTTNYSNAQLEAL